MKDVEERKTPLVATSLLNNVLTIRFNNPRRKNAWSGEMLREVRKSLDDAKHDAGIKAVVLTGTGDYYCSGVDFASSFPIMRPSLLVEHLRRSNQELFECFLLFPKPIIVAANGPAIGASVTSATLCDAIIAGPKATFQVPFAALGICPEGCSSYWFPKRLGSEAAVRMLGKEGWKPNAEEAREIGLVQEVAASDEDLRVRAQQVAEEWVAEGKQRVVLDERGELEKLLEVNAKESRALAAAFLSKPFLEAQYRAAHTKGKSKQAAAFWALLHSQPVWSRL